MKRIIFFLCILVACVAGAATLSVMQQFNVVNSSTSAPAQVTNSAIQATAITLIGMKAPQTSNSTTVWVSYGQDANGIQSVPVGPGFVVNLVLDPGRAIFVLSNLWFDVTTANDGLTVIYDQVK